MPVLYLVATPIGNLEDVTLRALRTLREVGLIAAEDTRRTKQLLAKYNIKTSLTSYHEHNKKAKLDYLLERLGSEDVALVSDAGMPGMSDPGYELVVAASEREIPVVAVPGPSAVITALAVSGLPVQRFVYLGFLPRRASSRVKHLESVAGECGSIVVLETPHRLRASLNDIRLALGDRRIAACRELTKVYEEVFRGTISEAIEHFTQPKGEFTLVIAGRDEEDKPQLTAEIEKQLSSMRQSGIRAREAITRTASETGLSRKELYRAWLKLPRFSRIA
ncbi:MAG: 16S rRNA (cytidine(1402)-2'-O)-methyltransferase [Dehalococcoidales bacterium]|nr:16S rRNA (cytidine(1402)-2'-O)-methyltransferase [Dehalococcoidales bacterium]